MSEYGRELAPSPDSLIERIDRFDATVDNQTMVASELAVVIAACVDQLAAERAIRQLVESGELPLGSVPVLDRQDEADRRTAVVGLLNELIDAKTLAGVSQYRARAAREQLFD